MLARRSGGRDWPAVEARLYGVSFSYPSLAARLMLRHKGIEHEWVKLAPGAHAFRVRLAGFRGGTVPALRLDGRRVVGSRCISRLLDEVKPEPPLFPADAARRRAVEEAEEWGETVLQPIPRRLLRWALRHHADARVMLARVLGSPRPELVARFMGPVAAFYARREDARSTERVRADWTALPGHLDHIEQLIADGVLGTPEPNAADFQIATSLRAMLAFEDYEPLLSGRPIEQLARRILPEYPYRFPSLMHLLH
jgi:glutathione S-transferase